MTTQFNFKSLFTSVLALSLFAFTVVSCGSDDNNSSSSDDTPTDDDGALENKTTGFVVVGRTSSGSNVVKYFEEIPEGSTVDISDGTDFSGFTLHTTFESSMYTTRQVGGPGFSKYVINADGEIELEGNISAIGEGTARLAIRDSQLGVFQDVSTPNIISVFNPETLQITGQIDMTDAFVPDDEQPFYQSFYFRGDDLFANISSSLNGDFFNSFIVHQASVSSNTFIGDTQRDGNGINGIRSIRHYGQNRIDDQGNIYIVDAGIFDGTGAINPALAVAGRLNRIPAGSNEFDPDYQFDPALILNPTNVVLPTTTKFIVTSNNKAIAIVNNEVPQEVIDIVNEAGGFLNLTPEQQRELQDILFSAASGRWCELDLEAQTVTPLNIPSVGPFSFGNLVQIDGEVYIPVVTETENAFYKYNEATGVTVKAFDVTGARISDLVDLSIDN